MVKHAIKSLINTAFLKDINVGVETTSYGKWFHSLAVSQKKELKELADWVNGMFNVSLLDRVLYTDEK